MKTLKRFLSFILVLSMLVGMVPPVAVRAEEIENPIPVETTAPPEETIPDDSIPEDSIPEESIPGETVPGESTPGETVPGESVPEESVPGESVPAEPEPPEVTRAQWISALTKAFDMQVLDDHYPDNYFSDLKEDSEYYYDLLLAVEFGVLHIPAGSPVDPDGAATREFAASTLNYCLGFQREQTEYSFTDWESIADPVSAQVAVDMGWLQCVDGAFVPALPITLAEMDAMLADAVSILADDEIDEDHVNTVVVADGVVEVPMGTPVTFVSDSVLELTDCPVRVSKDALFVVYNHDLPLTFRALSVEQDGNITRVEYTAKGAESALAFCDYEGVVDIDLSTFQPEEDVTYSIQRSSATSGKQSRGINYDEETQTLTVTKSIKTSSNSTGTLSAVITNMRLDVQSNSELGNYRYVLRGDATVTSDLTVKKEDEDLLSSLKLGVILIGGIGYVSVELEASISGSVTLQWEGDIKAGFAHNAKLGTRYIYGFHKKAFSLHAKVHASLGIKVSAVIGLLLFEGAIYVKYGGKCTVQDDVHFGKVPEVCMDIFAYFFAYIGVSGNLLGLVEFDEPLLTIFDEENSPYRTSYHYEAESTSSERVLVSKCTYTDQPTYNTPPTSSEFNPPMGGGRYDSTELYYYDLDVDDNAVIYAYMGNASVLVLPETLDGYPVGGIEAYTFYGNEKLTSIKLPNSLKYIGASAFESCTNLGFVWTEGSSLDLIDDSAFRDCSSLWKVILPESVTSMGSDVFNGCTALLEVNIPSGITAIPDRTFYNCKKLKSATIPDCVLKISAEAFSGCAALASANLSHIQQLENRAFYNCTSLKEVSLSKDLKLSPGGYYFGNCSSLARVSFADGITYIPAYLFQGCTGLKTLTVPKSVTSIGKQSFEGCIRLQSVVIPDTVQYLNVGCFKDCRSIRSLSIPESIRSIPDEAFSGCSSLTDLQLPEPLVSLGDKSFAYCTSLEAVTIPCNTQFHDSYDNSRNSPFTGCTGLKTVTLAKGNSDVPCCFLYDCSSVETVILPESVNTIQEYAFFGCSSLRNVEIGGHLSSIERGAFRQCVSLENFDIPQTLRSLGDSAFSGSMIEEAHLPINLASMGESVFQNCINLGKVSIPASLESAGKYCFRGCSNLKEVNIEEGFAEIFPYMFADCPGIEYIELPASVSLISKNAFDACENLKTVVFNGTVESIGSYAFQASGLEQIDLPHGLKKMGDEVFRMCSNLASVYIPDSLGSVGRDCFDYCSNLKDVQFEEGTGAIPRYLFESCEGIERLELPASISSIGESAFAGCRNLGYLIFHGEVTTISAYAFYQTGLAWLDLPQGLEQIGDYAFADNDLSMVRLPDSLKTIGAYAFYQNYSLDTVDLPGNLKSIGTHAFDVTSIAHWKIPKSLTYIDYYGLGTATETVTLEEGATKVPSRLLYGTDITSTDALILPESVTEFGDWVFGSCHNLTDASIPEGITALGTGTFLGCDALTTVKLPGSIDTLPDSTFQSCISLATPEFPDQITSIGADAFSYCSALESIELPDQITSIGANAFSCCRALESIELPEKLEFIGSHAFYDCSALQTITLPDSLTTMHGSVFESCTSLSDIRLPDSWTMIPDNMFDGCTALTEIKLPAALTSIGNGAFYNCTNLLRLDLPDSLTHIGEKAFAQCSSLLRVDIPEQVNTIAEKAFAQCYNLETVTMGPLVSDLGKYAFQDCCSLKDVRLSSSLRTLEYGVFSGCANLEELTLPVSIVSVHDGCPSNLARLYTGSQFRRFADNSPDWYVPEIYGVPASFAENWANTSGANFYSHTVKATGMTWAMEDQTFRQGLTYTISPWPVITPFNCTSSVSFHSSDETVVTVDYSNDGSFYAVSPGTATITASVDGFTASFDVTVIPKTVVTLDITEASLKCNETLQLNASCMTDGLTNKDYRWSSSDTSCVTVDENGLVTAHSQGTAVITAELKDSSSIQAACSITVLNTVQEVDNPKHMRIGSDVSTTDGPVRYYPDNLDHCFIFTYKDAVSITLFFHENSELEVNKDFLYIYDGEDQLIQTFTGAADGQMKVKIPGDTVKLHMVSDDSGSGWGYEVVDWIIDVPKCTHRYTAEQTSEPTCSKAGIITHTCTLCGDYYQESIPALGHIYVDTWFEPTCHMNGHTTRTCQRCGRSYWSKITPRLQHQYTDEWIRTTCETDGYFNHTCQLCGDNYKTQIHPAYGHDVTDGVCRNCEKVFVRIVTQPNRPEVRFGEQATVTIEAEGEELTYQWYYKNYGSDEFLLSTEFTGPTYSVELDPDTCYRWLYCVVTEKNGYSVTTKTTNLGYIQNNLEIVSMHIKDTVALGEQAEVRIEAVGDVLTYEWYVMGQDDTEFRRDETVTGPVYSLTMDEGKDYYTLYCIIKDWSGNYILTDHVTFTIEKTPLEIVSQPQDTWAAAGETAEFCVEATGDDLTYEWYILGLSDEGKVKLTDCTGPVCSLTMTPEMDACLVYCTVKDKYSNEIDSDYAFLYLEMAFAIILQQPADTVVNPGETAEVSLEATGDGLTYEWYIRDPDAVYSYRAPEATGPVYSVTMEESIAGRRVFCIVRDQYGNQQVSRTVTLSVPEMPLQIVNHPMSSGAAKGDPITVSVTAAGQGLTYEWYCKNAMEPTFHKAPEFTGPSYTVTMSLSVSNQQVYCVVTDAAGNRMISDTAFLSMTTPPFEIIAQPANVAVPDGQDAVVTFEVDGQDLTYTWYYQDADRFEFIPCTECTGPVYSVTMSEAVDGRMVYCLAADRYGNMIVSDIATLYLSSGNVLILTQPQNTAVREGETATVSLVADGDGLTYEWYVSDDYGATFFKDGSVTGPAYSVVMDPSVNGRHVYCLVSDQYGNSAFSDEVELILRREPVTIVTQPQDVTVAEGETAAVTLEVTGDVIAYEWYFRCAGMSNFVLAEDITGPAFSVTMVPAYDGCEVFCKILNWYDNTTVSDTVTLSMTKAPLMIVTQPQDVTVAEGETAGVSVEASGDSLVYEWYYRNPGDPNFRKTTAFTGPVYSVTMSAARSGRQIYCVITDAYGRTVTTDTVTLSMQTIPLEILVQPQDVTVAAGETAAVTLEAIGEGLTYQWYFRNPTGSKFALTTAFTGPTYSVSMSEARNGRQVYCVVTDAYGRSVTTETVTLSMAVKLPEILVQPEDVTVADGESATVTLEASGDSLTYEWYFRNAGSSKFSKTTVFTGPTYSVVMSGARDGRQVYCVVTDRYGNQIRTDTVTLSMVKNAVAIVTQPVDLEVENGEPATVTVDANGDGLVYEWYFMNAGGSKFSKTTAFTGPTYSVTMSAARDGRQVYCVITDAYGNSVTTNTVTLSMKVVTPLEIVTQPVDVTVAEGALAEVTLEATGDGLVYEWYFMNAGGSKFSKTTAFTGPAYSITMNTARDGRQVYCIITDAYGNSVTSDTVTLSMEQELIIPLEILTQPESVTVASGKSAKVLVEAVGDELTYQWYYKNATGTKFTETTTFTGPEYSLSMNASRSGRHVYCVITDKYGSSVQTDIVALNMASDLELLSQPESVTVASGKTAQVTVDAVGEGLSYAWYYRNAGSTAFTRTSTFTGDSYSLKMTEARSGRQVYCVITDGNGNTVATDIVTLTVSG